MGLGFLLLCTGDNASWLRSGIRSSTSVPTTDMKQSLGGGRQEGDVLLGAQLTPASAQWLTMQICLEEGLSSSVVFSEIKCSC